MGNPVYTVNGQPVSTVKCGDTIGFDVPGYPHAWVVVAQDGHITFDGPMDLPMPPYTLRCPDDVGFFQVGAYVLTPDGKRGAVIGSTSITVNQSIAPVVVNRSNGGTPPAPGATPPIIGGTPYTPSQIIETGAPAPPIQFNDTSEQPVGFEWNLTTIAIAAVAALVILPPLFRKQRG